MGQKCSAGMPDNVANRDPILSEVSRTIHSKVPEMLDFQASGNKNDFGSVEAFCKNMKTSFVFADGRVATVAKVRDSARPSEYSKILLKSIDSMNMFCDNSGCVAIITVECVRSLMPGLYEILENTVTMADASIKSEAKDKLDKGAKVTVDKVVRVGERLRGQLRGSKTWITLEKTGSDVQFVSLLQADQKQKAMGDLHTYSLTMERCENQEDNFEWKLIHVSMQLNN